MLEETITYAGLGQKSDMENLDPEIVLALQEPLPDREKSVVSNLNTIILPLGPFRNLTTLIGAILSLHPQAIVLNHAASRLFQYPEVDFLRDCTAEKQRNFLEVCVRLLQGGEGGERGGSILKAHAFLDYPVMKELYHKRYGDQMLKADARVLYWKDSQRIQNHININSDGIERVVQSFDNVKFILPIRNPIHCAKSNLRTKHWKYIVPGEKIDFETILHRILVNIRWAYTHQSLGKDRLLMIWEPELTSKSLVRICKFCKIVIDEQWIDDISSNVNVRERCATPEESKIYEKLVELEFKHLPEIYDRLISFIAADVA